MNIFKKIYAALNAAYYEKKGVKFMLVDWPTDETIKGEVLTNLLNEVLTPALQEMGFKWNGKYIWYTNPENGIRRVIHYFLLKGRGTLEWGISTDFIPIPSGRNLTYSRTENNLKLHLFEWTDGHKSSFYKKEDTNYIDDSYKGIALHIGVDHTRKYLRRMLDNEIDNIRGWFERASCIDGIINIAEEQIEFKYGDGKFNVYSIHYPNPKYVLAFMYSKKGDKDKARTLFEMTDDYAYEKYPELREKLFNKLMSL